MAKRRSQRPMPPRVDHARLAAELVKALQLPRGATATAVQPQGQVQSITGLTQPLVSGGWNDPMVAFGPGAPIRPAAIDPLDPITGRPLPRRYDYPVSFNLPGGGERMVPWTVLRSLADNVDVLRRCIEIRKAELVSLSWDVVVADSAIQAAMLEQGDPVNAASLKAAAKGDPQAQADVAKKMRVSKQSVEAALRWENAQQITDLRRWWAKPDRIQDWTFAEWLNVALEEHFVLDALAIYPHPDLAGNLHSLEIIAGDTIKPLLDHRGATPQPPLPAYQQILHGFPRGEFVATADADDEYPRDTLIYRPRNRRASSPYGLSNTEQAIVTADLYLKRQEWLRAEYTAGVSPEILVTVEAQMTPDQLMAYERIFNDTLSGQTMERHRAKFLPQGFTPHELTGFAEKYKSEFDEHLIRLLALEFDVMPTELGFPPKSGLGGSGHQEGEAATTQRKAVRPAAAWLTSILNEISSAWLAMPDTLTFKFLGLEAEDEQDALAGMESLSTRAAITVNEMRDETGRPRFDIPEADMPFFITGRDIVPLEGMLERLAAQAEAAAATPNVAAGDQGAEDKTPPASSPGKSDSAPKASASKVAEAQAFKSKIRNVRRAGRPWPGFAFSEHPEPIGEAANQLAADGEWAAAIASLDVTV